jgi:hypothetical protein
MISEQALDDLKDRHPCNKVAGDWVALRRGGKLGLRGPCPLHSPKANAKDSTAFECDAHRWVCAVCADGGDVIKLVALRHGLDPKKDFKRVVEILGGAAEPDAERAKQLEADRKARGDKAERDDNIYRTRERKAARAIWDAGAPIAGSPAAQYLALRGLTELPPALELRYAPDVAFFHGEEENEIGRMAPRRIYSGPAMLAPIVLADGEFIAVHITWIDLELPNGKAIIVDPETGEPLLSKKVRGSKSGGVIRLFYPRLLNTWCIGEGIETGLSVWHALAIGAGRDLESMGWGFAAAVDLGNLAGRAVASVRHPSLVDAAGRARKVPGPAADLAAPGLALPAGASDVLLLGDGDSDRFSTQCALSRAQERFMAQGAAVRCAWAPDGADFNDELRAPARIDGGVN